MVTKIELIVDLLQAAFASPVTESEYHLTVNCLRQYALDRDSRDTERNVVTSRGWPPEYDPCEHMERIRFAMSFGSTSNVGVMSAVNAWNRNNQLSDATAESSKLNHTYPVDL